MEREELKPKPSLLERWKAPWYNQFHTPKTSREELGQLLAAYHDWILRIGVYNHKPSELHKKNKIDNTF